MPSLTMEYNFRALTGQRITPGNTATAIGTNIIKYVEHKLHIDSGGDPLAGQGPKVVFHRQAEQRMLTIAKNIEAERIIRPAAGPRILPAFKR